MQQVSTFKDNKFNTAVARASNVKVSIDGLKTFKDIRRVLKEKPKLDVDTLDNEIPIHKELYVVRDTHPGYLMQAVATMYRMKWLAFEDGSPRFLLVPGVEEMDAMYAPKSDAQKARFKKMFPSFLPCIVIVSEGAASALLYISKFSLQSLLLLLFLECC
jgi:hypothetical protein